MYDLFIFILCVTVLPVSLYVQHMHALFHRMSEEAQHPQNCCFRQWWLAVWVLATRSCVPGLLLSYCPRSCNAVWFAFPRLLELLTLSLWDLSGSWAELGCFPEESTEAGTVAGSQAQQSMDAVLLATLHYSLGWITSLPHLWSIT